MAQAKLYVVINENTVIYSADTMDEGLAFMDGRGAGVLYGLLCKSRETTDRKKPSKRGIPEETHTRGTRKAS